MNSARPIWWLSMLASGAVAWIAYVVAVLVLLNRTDESDYWPLPAVGLVTFGTVVLGGALVPYRRMRATGVGVLVGTAAGLLTIIVIVLIALNQLGNATY